MYNQTKRTSSKNHHLSERALAVYFCLLERFIMSDKPITLFLSTRRIAELTGLSYWEVCLARIELICAGCLHPTDFSPYDNRNAYRFTELDIKDYGNDYWDRIAANFLPAKSDSRWESKS